MSTGDPYFNVNSTQSGTWISSNSIGGSINSGASVSNSYYGHPWGCSCINCSSQQTSGGLGQTYSTGTVSVGAYIPEPSDEIKSKPKYNEGVHDHVIECRFKVEPTKVTAEYFCCHCNEVLHSKVISKLPKSIMNKKCLPRLVKGV